VPGRRRIDGKPPFRLRSGDAAETVAGGDAGTCVPAPISHDVRETIPMRRIVAGAVVAAFAGVLLAGVRAADEKPKMTIKEVMKLHKDKLNEKFSNGTASKEEKQKLLEGYESMLKQKPPKGDEKDWKTKVEALVKAVKDDDKDAYKKAVMCGACHTAHKGS
jgi:hypothetical protein